MLWAIAYTAIIGGVIGIGYAVYRRRLLEVARNLGRAALGRVRPGSQPGLRELSDLTIPYGIAIALGSLWAAAMHYFPRAAIF